MITKPLENPSSSLVKTPSDTLLRNFRATLETRWSQFDEAVPSMGKSGIFASKDYLETRKRYERAISLLSKIQNDEELRKSTEIIGELDDTLVGLNKHIGKITTHEAQEKYNQVLVAMRDDLAGLKADLVGKPEIKAELTKVAPIATAAVAGAAGVSLMEAETRTMIDQAVGEKKEWFGLKKMFAGFIKEGIEDTKKGEWSFARIAGGFIGTITGFLSKIGLDIDFSKYLTADELKLAGLTPKVSEVPKPTTLAENLVEKDEYTPARIIFETLLLERTSSLPYTNILDNIQMKGTTIGELESVERSKMYGDFLTKIGLKTDEKFVKGLTEILAALFTGNKGKYVLEAYNSKKGNVKGSAYPKSEKFSDYLITAGHVIKKMGGIATAAISHSMPESTIKYDTSTQDVVFNDIDEGTEALKLFDGDKKLIAYMLGTNSKEKVKMGDIGSHNFGQTLTSAYPEIGARSKAEKTLKKVMNFGKSFLEGVISNPDLHLGMNNELRAIMSERDFTMRGYALMYMTLGGKNISNFSQLSTIEQAQIYGMIMTIFQTADKSYDKGQLTSRYLTALSESKSEIPKVVSVFLKDAGLYAGKRGLSVLEEGVKYIAGLAGENPKLAAIFAALNIPFIPSRDAVVDFL